MSPAKLTLQKTILIAAIALQGCNGDSDNDEIALKRGVFLDSPVRGLRYETPTQTGTTDSEGAFYYSDGESVVFSIGELNFPAVEATTIVTPIELAQVDDIEDERAVNLLRLLQTIDVDQNPENGIVIPSSAHEKVTISKNIFNGSIDVEQFLGDIVAQIYDDGRELVKSEDAITHLVDTLSKEAAGTDVKEQYAPITFLVEVDGEYEGGFLSLQDSNFSLNLEDNWQHGTLKQTHNVLQLKSTQGSNKFLTSGLEGDQTVYCIGNRPYPVSDCGKDGKLYAVFNEERKARQFNTVAEESIKEPLIGEAQEENSSDTTDSDDSSAAGSEESASHEEQGGNTGTDTNVSTDVNTGTDTNVSTDVNTGTDVDTGVDSSTTDSSGEGNSESKGDASNPIETVVVSTNCPNSLKAPTRFSVIANAPSGCQWDNFDGPAWSWSPTSTFSSTDNTITAADGGTYVGDFSHTCTDTTTGETRDVTASCTVEVASAPGIEDITELFFITGQSNAAGLETQYDAALDAPGSRVFAFTDLGWQVADLHQYWERSLPGNFSAADASRSPYNSIAFQLSRAVAEKSGRVVGLVVLTAPGEGISHWDYNSEFSIRIREKATAALNALPNKSSFDAMIWMQGETDWLFEGTADPGATGFADTSDGDYKNYYPSKLFQLVSNLRSEGWFQFDGRFICAETKKADLNPHLMALNNDDDPLTGCAAASDLATRSADQFGNHFSAESLRTLGQRLADVYLSMD